MKTELEGLHVFRDSELLRRALTHASAGAAHNERLEWLGDSLLDFLASDFLFKRHPRLSEGALTRARIKMVNGKTLAALARQSGMPKHIKVSSAEKRGGGRERDSILEGALEAYFAAIYLDGGMAAARRAAAKLFADILQEVDRAVAEGGGMLKDGKTRLQEYLQKRGEEPPQYAVLARGETARRAYCVAECRLDARRFAAAVAGNRREAEQAAGECMFAALAG
ncbi:MAG: ribonuclease III [Betaproteobacteria bacterium]|nr:ribonuclease III [Betaproteobacteria bacterium]